MSNLYLLLSESGQLGEPDDSDYEIQTEQEHQNYLLTIKQKEKNEQREENKVAAIS